MFDEAEPRLFGLPPGADFAEQLVAGLRQRLAGPPEEIAKIELFVNTTRMARRLRTVFDAGEHTFLPKIKLVTNLADPLLRAKLPCTVPPLRRRLELTQLVSRLLDAEKELAPRSALFDLSDSLASLMEEMQGEGVLPETVANLDVSDQSGHWARALQFIKIVQPFFDPESEPDSAGFNRIALRAKLESWQQNPPQNPIIIAGSTGSRGTTAELMRAVTQLPQGAVILPGFDFDMPQTVWDRLALSSDQGSLAAEDHPQYRFARMMADLDYRVSRVGHWANDPAPSPARNAVVSLALRPAPVTHQWRSEGPNLPSLPDAMNDVTLLEARSPREEAIAIALRLREAAEKGTRAALITPDRMLTRQVTSALDRWDILPDDSAGTPAQLSPPGRLLRHVAELFSGPLTAEALLTLLKHPLTHTGAERGPHRLNSSNLELHIRRKGWPYPDADLIRAWGQARNCPDWANWVAKTFSDNSVEGQRSLADWVKQHIALASAIVAGSSSDDAGALWAENAGRVVKAVVQNLEAEAGYGADMSAMDYASLFGAILSQSDVRDRDAPHPNILIWGTLEARVMDADLLILAGLNEGSWPEMPGADPWLNRKMRSDAGLLLPERRIGLSAHDFQQAAAAPEVWLTRAVKSDDAETVPSRWVNRLMNLMAGLPAQQGPDALGQMKDRGAHWLALARVAETPIETSPEPRPSPAPPVDSRPRQLSVTAIKRLVRDPYDIYASKVLRLRELDPLMRAPDALMRGIMLHDTIEAFLRESMADPNRLTPESFMEVSERIIGDPGKVPFPTTRALWLARMQKVADWFVQSEKDRQFHATPHPDNFEVKGAVQLPLLGFTLTAQADRIDIDERGGAYIYDYKTGKASSEQQQIHFDRQLLLEAAMVLEGGFPGVSPRHIEAAKFVSLKPSDPKQVEAPLEQCPPQETWQEFTRLITAYLSAEQGFTARRALLKDDDRANYDHLSRFGEWDVTDAPKKVVLK
ncbi:double-strand break repair protein AddB [Thalassococcus lentus]|uniref:Double-strand break repair protein AddB n=1 Tax=Thalassococcus lentus TaxID=1210524 RepID=A0ABT4XNF0_9RHOB|nr:double-strand break repair protein AddB [Thalassococcus lentus]MDA7423455.1 double-strand break repair protein AddB [Thalassococcus lentus]